MFKDYKKVPPLVTEELWEKANQKLRKKKQECKNVSKTPIISTISGNYIAKNINVAMLEK